MSGRARPGTILALALRVRLVTVAVVGRLPGAPRRRPAGCAPEAATAEPPP